MSAYQELVTRSERILQGFLEDTDRYLSTITPAEKAFAVCIFGLVLMFFIMRQPKTYADGGGMGRQFFFALTIIMLMGFGVGWLYGGDIQSIFLNL